MRKTVGIADLVALVNRRNRESICKPAVREGWNALLCRVLHAAGVYDGFRYLTAADVPLGCAAGIAYTVEGVPAKDSADRPILPDATRIAFFLHRKLRD